MTFHLAPGKVQGALRNTKVIQLWPSPERDQLVRGGRGSQSKHRAGWKYTVTELEGRAAASTGKLFVHYFFLLAFQCSNTFTWHKMRKGQQSGQGKFPFRLSPGPRSPPQRQPVLQWLSVRSGVFCAYYRQKHRELFYMKVAHYILCFLSLFIIVHYQYARAFLLSFTVFHCQDVP